MPCSNSWTSLGNGMEAVLASYTWTAGEKCREKWMHKPAAHTFTSLSCFGATAAAPGPGGTTATPLLLSLSWTMRGEGTTLQGVCHTHHSPAKTRCGYKLGRFSNCRAFCSSLHLQTISPPLKCFALFITFHLTPATSSK